MGKRGFYERYIKRLLDIILSLLALIVLSPLLLVVAALVGIKLGRPVIYRQKRVGRGEKVFSMCKFRSMPDQRDAGGKMLPDEERLTPFGRFIRSTSIDELPELWNIIKGDMSIIGPRPLPPIYLDYYTAEEARRHTARPGLSGLSQVNGRNELTWEEKFAYDNEYIDRMSLALDCKIVIQTIIQVFKRSGIGQGEQAPESLHIQRQRQMAEEALGRTS